MLIIMMMMSVSYIITFMLNNDLRTALPNPVLIITIRMAMHVSKEHMHVFLMSSVSVCPTMQSY